MLVVENGNDPRRARRQVLTDLVVDLILDPVIDELADHPTRNRTDRHRREQRRGEQPDGEPDPAAPAHPLAAEIVARLPHGDAAILRVRDKDHALDLDSLVFDERDERLEVSSRPVDVLVTGDENVGRRISHWASWQRAADSDPRFAWGRHPIGRNCRETSPAGQSVLIPDLGILGPPDVGTTLSRPFGRARAISLLSDGQPDVGDYGSTSRPFAVPSGTTGATRKTRGFCRDIGMGRAGIEPATLGLRVPCSTS